MSPSLPVVGVRSVGRQPFSQFSPESLSRRIPHVKRTSACRNPVSCTGTSAVQFDSWETGAAEALEAMSTVSAHDATARRGVVRVILLKIGVELVVSALAPTA